MSATAESLGIEPRVFNLTHYIGVKRVRATPLTLGDYLTLREQGLAEGRADEPGYLVEYLDGGEPNMPGVFDGYVSWSPKDVFERAYRTNAAAIGSFSDALEALKLGYRVTRKAWLDRGTELQVEYREFHPGNKLWVGNKVLGASPWPSIPGDDLLADDWLVAL
jgi:hypothetical protein